MDKNDIHTELGGTTYNNFEIWIHGREIISETDDCYQ